MPDAEDDPLLAETERYVLERKERVASQLLLAFKSLVATQQLEMRGAQALPWLLEQAEIVEGLGDHDAARVWREIAQTCEELWEKRS
jgi:hypothetical protein